MRRISHLLRPALVTLLAAALLACGSTPDPNGGRQLISIQVTPETADAQNFPNGQVPFTATGTFNLPPLSDALTTQAPYSGQFVALVDQSTHLPVATVAPTGAGTWTAQCLPGASGTALLDVTANANSGLTPDPIISSSAQLVCP